MIDIFYDGLGGRIHCSSYGPDRADARTVVCLHGNSSSGDAFRGIAAGLVDADADLRVISVDFPGHGQSDGHAQFQKYYSFQGFSEVVLGLIDGLGIAPSTIIGHSMGGHIATQAAAKIPSLERLILISSPPIAGAQSIGRFFRADAPIGSIFAERLSSTEIDDLALGFTTDQAPESALAAIRHDIARTDGVFRSDLGASLSGADVVDELSILKGLRSIDLQLIGGELDRFINPDYYADVVGELGLRAEQSSLLRGVGHYPHLERQADTLRLVQSRMRIAAA
jgi:pimeloyl-ACP methyl ester carboxylesterase